MHEEERPFLQRRSIRHRQIQSTEWPGSIHLHIVSIYLSRISVTLFEEYICSSTTHFTLELGSLSQFLPHISFRIILPILVFADLIGSFDNIGEGFPTNQIRFRGKYLTRNYPLSVQEKQKMQI
jgi:hypothetical protein